MAEILTDEERLLMAAAFDAAFYLAGNPDVAESGADPVTHFLTAGWRENRDPTAQFSLRAYLDANEDVALSGINPYLHYLTHGRAEGRPIRLELGFRHAILNRAVALEDRLELTRGHDIAGGSDKALAKALARLGPRLFITVSHDAYVDRVGGVQSCLRREAQALAGAGWSRLHLYPALPSLVTDFETLDPVVGLMVDGEKQGLFAAARVARALAQRHAAGAVEEAGFAVHSFLGHSVEAVSDMLSAAGAQDGFLWLHDQSSLCAGYVLLRDDVAFCGAPPPDSGACSICIYGLRRKVQIADHAAFFRRFQVRVVAPSQAQLTLFEGAGLYPGVAAQAHPHAALIPRPGAPTAATDGPLRVAFLGHPADRKGWPVFEALAERFADDPRYAFFHMGAGKDGPRAVTLIDVTPTLDDISPMTAAIEAAGIDVALILSICPETFCFTAHEAVAAGAAVVAFPASSAVARLAADPAFGRVVADEAALQALFDSGEIVGLSRGVRRPPLFDLDYSALSADLLQPAGARP